MNRVLANNPVDYFSNVRKLSPSEVGRRRNFISKWSKDYKVLMQDVMGLEEKLLKDQLGSARELALSCPHYMRLKLNSINSLWSEERVLKTFQLLGFVSMERKYIWNFKSSNPEKWEGIKFTGSYGWMRRFIKRKKIKLYKRKSQK